MNPSSQVSMVLFAIAMIVGCGGGTEPLQRSRADSENQLSASASSNPDAPVMADERRTPSMDGFSWLVDGELAAMPLPGRHRDLAVDAEFLRMEGVRTLVSLTETPPDAGVLSACGIAQAHIPVCDFTAPTLEQMIEFVDVVRISAARGKRTIRHDGGCVHGGAGGLGARGHCDGAPASSGIDRNGSSGGGGESVRDAPECRSVTGTRGQRIPRCQHEGSS